MINIKKGYTLCKERNISYLKFGNNAKNGLFIM